MIPWKLKIECLIDWANRKIFELEYRIINKRQLRRRKPR